MTSEIIAVTPETLPSILWQNQPVITTDLLADIYGAKAIQIQQNFKNNASRFIEGVHFFKLVGAELKAFKNQLDKIELVKIAKNTAHLMLWTERGTVRHAKILDTDNAWAVQDRLEDFYFQKNQPKPYGLKELPPAYLSHDMKRHIQELVNEQKIKTGKNHNTIYHDLKTHFQTSTYAEIPITKYGDVCAWFGAKPKYELPQMVSIDVKELEALRALPSPSKSGELIDDEVTHIKYKTGRVLSVGEFIQETKENPLSSWCLVHKDWLKKLKDATTVLV